MLQPIVLLADLDGLIRIALIVLFLLGPLIGQFFKSKEEAPAQPRRPARPRPRPPAAQPPAGGPPAEPAEQLEVEIDEFLRRMTGRPEAKGPARADGARPQPQRGPTAQPATPAPPRSVARPPLSRDVIEAEMAPLAEQPLAARPADPDRLSPRRLGGQWETSGQRISQEVERMETHVHEVFDHQLGKLDLSAGVDAEVSPPSPEVGVDVWEGSGVRQTRQSAERVRQVDEIKKLLREPYDVRQAIVLSEILKRPEL